MLDEHLDGFFLKFWGQTGTRVCIFVKEIFSYELINLGNLIDYELVSYTMSMDRDPKDDVVIELSEIRFVCIF